MNKIAKIAGISAASFVLAIVLIVGAFCFFNLKDKKIDVPTNIADTVERKVFNDNEYCIIKKDYGGEYDIQTRHLDVILFPGEYDINEPDVMAIMSYDEMSDYCKEWDLNQKYDDKSKNYIVFTYTADGAVSVDARLAAVDYEETGVNLYVWDSRYGIVADASFYTIIIPTEKTTGTTVFITPVFTPDEYDTIRKKTLIPSLEEPIITVDKPIIYLYPEKDTNIEVSLVKPELITHSYPKYDKKWNVIASPDGTLKDIATGRTLYSLYYESDSYLDFKVEEDGFIIKGEDAASFLEDKLEVLGLNEKEAEEFIIYWLPILESNEYNYIRFATTDEINENMPLTINPAPDTTIRVLMIFKGLDKPIDVKEQILEHIERNGFTAVEWGGVQLK